MRRLFWSLLMVALLGAITFPGIYFYYAKDLPNLGSASQVRAVVTSAIEGERRGRSMVGTHYEDVGFELTPIAKLPKALVSGVLTVDGCPEFLTAKKERGMPRYRRLAARLLFGDKSGGPGPGRCQMLYADLVASTMGAVDPMHATIADSRILNAVDPEELLAYRININFFATGVLGAQEGARKLFKKGLDELSLSEIAELLAAEGYFPDFVRCKNPARLQRIRDAVLERMEAYGFIDEAQSRAAQAPQVSCNLHP